MVKGRVRVTVRVGPGNALAVFFLSSGLISVVNTFVFGGSVSARRITYGYSIDDVTTTWIVVNLASPMFQTVCSRRSFSSPSSTPGNEANNLHSSCHKFCMVIVVSDSLRSTIIWSEF